MYDTGALSNDFISSDWLKWFSRYLQHGNYISDVLSIGTKELVDKGKYRENVKTLVFHWLKRQKLQHPPIQITKSGNQPVSSASLALNIATAALLAILMVAAIVLEGLFPAWLWRSNGIQCFLGDMAVADKGSDLGYTNLPRLQPTNADFTWRL
jgi:hypothetical protein